MELYLVRHAIAAQRDFNRWPDDLERPLTREGERRFRRVAGALRLAAPKVDLVLSSPLTRAWQTAEILASEAGWPTPTRSDALAAGEPLSAVLDALTPHLGRDSVALVGHEPDLSELASFLIAGTPNGRVEMKKGGVACLRVDGEARPAAGMLRWLLTPGVVLALGEPRSA